MKREKNDDFYISRIINDIDYILSILEDVELDDFARNDLPVLRSIMEQLMAQSH